MRYGSSLINCQELILCHKQCLALRGTVVIPQHCADQLLACNDSGHGQCRVATPEATDACALHVSSGEAAIAISEYDDYYDRHPVSEVGVDFIVMVNAPRSRADGGKTLLGWATSRV